MLKPTTYGHYCDDNAYNCGLKPQNYIRRYNPMKSIIKATLILALFLATLGTVGACEVGNISLLHCLIQGVACILALYFTMKWRTAK